MTIVKGLIGFLHVVVGRRPFRPKSTLKAIILTLHWSQWIWHREDFQIRNDKKKTLLILKGPEAVSAKDPISLSLSL